MNLPGFAVRRPVTVLMIFLAVVIFGLFSFSRLPIDLYPEIELPTITIITTYPGASALEVEEKVSRLLEGEIAIISGIKKIKSISKTNLSAVSCEFHYGTDLDEASSEIRDHLEFVRSRLPADAENPMVLKINTAMFPVVMLAVYNENGDVFEDFDLIEDLVYDRLRSLEGVGSITVFNQTPQRVELRIDRDRLEFFDLTLQDIITAITMSNVSAPAGTLEVGIYDYSLELKGEFRTLEELRQLVIGSGRSGGLVYLKDVAEVLTTYVKEDMVALSNMQPCLFGMVNKRSGANTVEVAKRIIDYLPVLEKDLPPGIKTEIVYDLSSFIVDMIKNLTQTVYFGGIFVVLVVFFFLRNIRSSFIISTAIPASLITAFGGLALFGYTLNMFSLMSLAVAVGMVVDNAVVVMENITRHRDMGKGRARAANEGGREVANAVLASTLTSVVIFGPLVFISGFVGVLFKQLAFVVIIVLSASLMVSLLLTPALSSWILSTATPARRKGIGTRLSGIAQFFGSGMKAVESGYSRLIGKALHHPWLVILAAIIIFVFSLSLAGSLGTGFMPKQDVGDITVAIELPVGTATNETDRIARQVLDIMMTELKPWIQRTYFRAGSSEEGIGAAFGNREGPNIAEIGVHLIPVNERPLTTHAMADMLRPKFAAIPEIKTFSITTDSPLNQIFSGGAKPLTLNLKGPNLEVLKADTEKVRELVAAIPGTVDVTAVIPEDRPEFRVEVDRLRASRLGVPVATAASAMRSGFYGMEIGTFRSNGTELDIFLRLQEQYRSRPEDVLNLPIRTMSGQKIRLGNLAALTEGTTPLQIDRSDQQRSTSVQGDIRGRALGDISAEIDKKLADLELGTGVTVEFGGDVEEQRKTMTDFIVVLLMGVVLVYMVMAGQFESFLDPFVIMLSLPFAFSGVFIALFLTRTELTVPAFMALIMLMGIVVNNAIVLIDFVQQLRERGYQIKDALIEAGKLRLRPIAMTTMTTIFGTIPMAVAGGSGHEMWRPMGIAIIGGLLFSTLVTLILIPVVYSRVDVLKRHLSDEEAPALEKTDPGVRGGIL